MSVGWYRGYSPKERAAKGRHRAALVKAGTIPFVNGPCSICGSSGDVLVPHGEDYSSNPYLFVPPAEYVVCRAAHAQIHLRFRHPECWRAFLEHVRRGGRCAEWMRAAPSEGAEHGGRCLPPATRSRGWWEELSTDPRSLTDPKARPRP